MKIHLQSRTKGLGGIKTRQKFLFVPLVHRKTLYWLEKVKLHYCWNGSRWVIIDILDVA
jgi:hypothetical protein